METQIMNEEYKAMQAKALEQLRSGQSLTGKDEAVSKQNLGRSFFLHFSHFLELGFYLDLILDSESELQVISDKFYGRFPVQKWKNRGFKLRFWINCEPVRE